MKRLYARAAVLVAMTLVASSTAYFVLLQRAWDRHGGGAVDPSVQRILDEVYMWSTCVDVGLVGLAAVVLIGPVYTRLRRINGAARQIQGGARGVRVGLSGRDLLAELGGSFDAMAAATEQQLDNQRALMRAVSHELRTPVARLRFVVEALVHAEPHERDARRRDADRDLDQLDALVDEILVVSRASPGGAPLRAEPVELAGELRELVGALGDLGPSIELDGPPAQPIEAEPRLLRRAVQNLLVNAQRHARSRVRLSLATDPEGATIVVDDDGPGVPAALRPRVFDPFVQGRPSEPGHHGLGLAITRAVARRHGGEVSLHPGPGPLGGARFTLRLPHRVPPSVRARYG